MPTKSVYVEVDVEMEDFGDEDIRDEYESRGLGASDLSDDISEMYYAFHFGKAERALELARKIACDATGRIL